jgi:hypothetical protein
VFSIWCSWIACDGTLSSMSYVTDIISNNVSLLFVNHEECLRLLVVLQRLSRLPLPHFHLYLSITLSLERRMLLPHVGQSISVFKSPHSCRNLTPFSWLANKNPKNILVGNPLFPTTLRSNDPFGTEGKFFKLSW